MILQFTGHREATMYSDDLFMVITDKVEGETGIYFKGFGIFYVDEDWRQVEEILKTRDIYSFECHQQRAKFGPFTPEHPTPCEENRILSQRALVERAKENL